MLHWIETWRKAGPELARIRREEIRHADTREAIETLDDASESAFRLIPARVCSGFVEQQRWFLKAMRCGG